MEESPSDYNTWQHGHLQTYKSVSDPDKEVTRRRAAARADKDVMDHLNG